MKALKVMLLGIFLVFVAACGGGNETSSGDGSIPLPPIGSTPASVTGRVLGIAPGVFAVVLDNTGVVQGKVAVDNTGNFFLQVQPGAGRRVAVLTPSLSYGVYNSGGECVFNLQPNGALLLGDITLDNATRRAGSSHDILVASDNVTGSVEALPAVQIGRWPMTINVFSTGPMPISASGSGTRDYYFQFPVGNGLTMNVDGFNDVPGCLIGRVFVGYLDQYAVNGVRYFVGGAFPTDNTFVSPYEEWVARAVNGDFRRQATLTGYWASRYW